MYRLLYLIPKNYLSFWIGKLARIQLPKSLMIFLLQWFCRRYKVAVNEAEHDLSEYQSFQAFFIRNLRAGLRPIGEGLVSPVDGRIVEFGEITDGTLVQAKGKIFLVSDLLFDNILTAKFNGGYYITIYLAPGDYHHIHSPISGRLISSIYVPGALWPVNNWSVNNIENLFPQNERIISVIENDGLAVAVVKVGATNVGSISVVYSDLVSNACPGLGKGGREVMKLDNIGEKNFQRGERLGTFNLGSTVILLIEKGWFLPGSMVAQMNRVRFGESLGALNG